MTMQPVLPPGISQARFAEAIAEFREIVGEQWVIVDLDRLAPYVKLMIPEDEVLHQPAGAIAASSVEEIQKILAVCTKYKTPIWTISTGRNFGYGSAAPATPGQLILDLRRMDRILDVDPEMCTALVEPGVTYRQLQDYIDEHKLPLWLSFPGPGPIVGPVGNTLDRGRGYNRYGEHMAFFCGLEVVLADGSLVRTAMGGLEKSTAWQCYRWGYGPWVDGLFSQSNFGVVTKMGIWLMHAPPAHKAFFVDYDDLEGVGRAVDTIRKLHLLGVLENGILGNALYPIAETARRSDIYRGPGAIPDSVLRKYLASIDVKAYSAFSTLYGTEGQIAANLKTVREAFAPTGGKLVTEEELPPARLAAPALRHEIGQMSGELDLTEFGVYNFRGGGGSTWFAPVVPARGRDAVKSINLSKAVLDEFGFDYMGGFLFAYSGRCAEHVLDLQFDRSDPQEMKRAHNCFQKLIAVNAAEGYAPYRVSTAFMKQVADVYGPEQKALNKRLKRALDPHGILAPGKSGIYL
jgi:4-cresol dehydrogenase (hydroxylating)